MKVITIIGVFLNILSLITSQSLEVYKRIHPLIRSTCKNASFNTNTILSAGNCNNYQYNINISIGTPPQNFEFVFDTGSFTMWVPTIQTNKNGFNTTSSSTYSITDTSSSIQYGSKEAVSGLFGTDFITILPLIQISQQILFVNQSSVTFQGNAVGIVGMGFTSDANFLDLAYEAGQIKTNVFSLYLKNFSQPSIIYYNQIPQGILNSTLYSPLPKGSYGWQLNLIGFFAGDQDMTQQAEKLALIDSGTSFLCLNAALYNAIVNQFLSSCTGSPQQPYFICACDIDFPALKFMFEGVQIVLNSSSYVTNLKDGTCHVYLNSDPTSPFTILGDPVFLNYIITFDKGNSSVGFYGDTEEIYIIGNGDNFEISQYTMIAIEIILLALTMAVFFVMVIQRVKYYPTLVYSQSSIGSVDYSLESKGSKGSIDVVSRGTQSFQTPLISQIEWKKSD